jgi:hypothetical protein
LTRPRELAFADAEDRRNSGSIGRADVDVNILAIHHAAKRHTRVKGAGDLFDLTRSLTSS